MNAFNNTDILVATPFDILKQVGDLMTIDEKMINKITSFIEFALTLSEVYNFSSEDLLQACLSFCFKSSNNYQV